MTRAKVRGFTMLEVMFVAVISIPILMAILSTTDRLSRQVNANERSADVTDVVRRVAEHAGRLLRAAHFSTFRMRATAADVAAAKASTVGEWITAPQLDGRAALQFQSASGTLSLNAAVLTTPRELEFVLDDGETANSLDDDGDGLVDEGRLLLSYESIQTQIADGVESCTFLLDGQVVRFSLQCAKADGDALIHRASIQYVWMIRNP